ncbi:MAG: nucleoside kinase [Lachnospiraceae bacterium]|nr:nucleoside kinase [Lachnospiraceae bacterium]
MATIKFLEESREYPAGTTFEKVVSEFQKDYDDTIALVVENGKIRELFKRVSKDCELKPITYSSNTGHKTYCRSAIMMMLKAFDDVLGRENIERIKVEFVIADGYYCTYKGTAKLTADVIVKVKERMQELVKENLPFIKESTQTDEAIKLFAERGFNDKVSLFKYRRSSTVNVYKLGDYIDYYYGYMLPSTGYVKWFDIMPYDDGFMLILPNKNAPKEIAPFDDRKTLFKTLKASTDLGEKLNVSTVGELNDAISEGRINDLILVQEALQERRISEIARDIVDRGTVKFVLIAGPSSSGKTSFSHRLSIQLRTYGLKPHPIACDDYYVNRVDTPRDKDGNYDFECLEAIDIPKFNDDMSALLNGELVELPHFNFKTGLREYNGNYLQLESDDILVIEGIHGLNDKLTEQLPSDSKYKIYISALTSINIDEHNRIPTTDGRLFRRMVRDARTRGTTAQNTIKMWPSVRRGEENNIFPFQENADAMFNSILLYELAAFKTYAEPLLFQIPKDAPEYFEAKRLLKFLEYFVALDPKVVPNNSLCREFIGGSFFPV